MYQQQYISIVGRIIAKQADELQDRQWDSSFYFG